jgi:hypothetical protein
MANESYLTPAELPTYYDLRRVLELASDTGEAATEGDLGSTSSDAYAFVMSAIRKGASDLDSHCQMGKRYTRATLQTIISEALASPADEVLQKRAALIRQIVADLAFGIMLGRRGFSADAVGKLAPRYEEALATLERLSQGFQVFDLDDNIQAGVPSRARIGRLAYRPGAFNRMFGVWEDSYDGTLRGTVPYLFGRW